MIDLALRLEGDGRHNAKAELTNERNDPIPSYRFINGRAVAVQRRRPAFCDLLLKAEKDGKFTARVSAWDENEVFLPGETSKWTRGMVSSPRSDLSDRQVTIIKRPPPEAEKTISQKPADELDIAEHVTRNKRAKKMRVTITNGEHEDDAGRNLPYMVRTLGACCTAS